MYRFTTEFRGHLPVEIFAASPEACIARFKDVMAADRRSHNDGWQADIDAVVEAAVQSPDRFITALPDGTAFVDHEQVF
ncbi:hypothetical protein MARCHEWKA_03230 [Brevundimonas phage vB_BpoS-Marchewka]|uniref:Uncharacterized protein n=1 Tax=Brevundimonas phage vB_BpoS-Marchewka TaxID=2948604 RepID=A0A9E7ST88_9CAUD|nr:hypothetical protein MARCHEWKA_03230 [Brevundimonas phage vB_BpoS-Marchewka]UTC29282.1 hypothetical protein BAMBUS_02000 [Brevundimonas phage vB_BpoS-Bambus]